MKQPKSGSNLIYVLIIALFAAGLFMIFNPTDGEMEKVNLDQFIQQAEDGEVAEIEVLDNRINFTLIDDTKQYAFKEPDSTVNDLLQDVPENIRKDISIEV
ncbi:MAG TPA: ATP-dependent metallopeptidase FtsH/Yme1/Tma family protein, partial [Candidatus Gracilibacteria bacterium]|nr:ATP-dependent metallopeptidase FtsH/Yme1/Tma family protein [Candidatus Gracilibacteria bacterium]